jgi:hypothetical protein
VAGIGTIPGVADAAKIVPIGDEPACAATIRALIEDHTERASVGARSEAFVQERFRVSDAARAAAAIVEQSTT